MCEGDTRTPGHRRTLNTWLLLESNRIHVVLFVLRRMHNRGSTSDPATIIGTEKIPFATFDSVPRMWLPNKRRDTKATFFPPVYALDSQKKHQTEKKKRLHYWLWSLARGVGISRMALGRISKVTSSELSSGVIVVRS